MFRLPLVHTKTPPPILLSNTTDIFCFSPGYKLINLGTILIPGDAIPAGKVIGRGVEVGCGTDEGRGTTVDPEDIPNIDRTLTPSTE